MLGGDAGRERAVALLNDADPRVRVVVAVLLLERDDLAGLRVAAAALPRTESFFDDRWGERLGDAAARAIADLAARRGTAVDPGPTAARAARIEAAAAWAQAQLGEALPRAGVETAVAVAATGGLEVRSCRNGDLFCRWSDDGRVWLGLEPQRELQLGAAVWRELRDDLPSSSGVRGSVVCDYLRLLDEPRQCDLKVAPGAADQPIADWSARLADLLGETGETEAGAQLRARLGQFAAAR
jgi:hypothetical protein